MRCHSLRHNRRYSRATSDATATAAAAAVPSQQVRTVSPHYQHIAETRHLTWTDDFFDDEADEIVAVFDLGYETLESFYIRLRWAESHANSASVDSCAGGIDPMLLSSKRTLEYSSKTCGRYSIWYSTCLG
jgi:hypothetical protein